MDRNNETAEISRRDFSEKYGTAGRWHDAAGRDAVDDVLHPEKRREVAGERARVALIGTGSRGQYHIHNLREISHAEVVALCDDYEPNLRAAQQLCPEAKGYTDYRRLLDDPSIDGVIIATPLNWHARMTLDALAAGKHVFCEKAMARTLDECRAIYDAYQRTDRALYFCMQRMYDEKVHPGHGTDPFGTDRRCGRHALPLVPQCRLAAAGAVARTGAADQLASLPGELGRTDDRAGLPPAGGLQLGGGRMPEEIMGMGDIVHWKDGREVYDSVNVIYRYADGRKICYESLISNKFNGMEDQILGSRGTMELAKGVYYLEEDHTASGIRQLIGQLKERAFAAIPAAGPSWRPETRVSTRRIRSSKVRSM